MAHILIVDDEPGICEILEFNLTSEGFAVTSAPSAEEALRLLRPEHELILLDVMMGGMSGYKMAETLRRQGNHTPIIFLTAKDTENDMLTGFSVGGDDYISKPFSIKEVVARVKAVLRRKAPRGEEGGVLECGPLRIDPALKEAYVSGERIALTRTEFQLLALLASQPGRVFSRENLIDILWKETPYITERTVDVHITRLRKKLGEAAAAISSRPGFGYRFDAEAL